MSHTFTTPDGRTHYWSGPKEGRAALMIVPLDGGAGKAFCLVDRDGNVFGKQKSVAVRSEVGKPSTVMVELIIDGETVSL
ncbi:hypothetical protein ACSMXM_05515 [Pacificimonas sp. ICDLI1SI03]